MIVKFALQKHIGSIYALPNTWKKVRHSFEIRNLHK